MEHDLLIPSELPPRATDAAIAMRVPSLIVLLASIWFLATPTAYYGMWRYDNASVNCLLVGSILVLSAILRLWFPLATVGFSWFNMILGIWVFISPWVLGYSDYTGALINTLCLGVVIAVMSFLSVQAKRLSGTPLNTAYEDWQGLQHQDYDYIGTDRY